jgi:hypothetical protein
MWNGKYPVGNIYIVPGEMGNRRYRSQSLGVMSYKDSMPQVSDAGE